MNQTMTCPYCHSPLAPAAVSCANCGAQVASNVGAAQPAPSQPGTPPQGQYGAVPPQGQYGAVPPQGQYGAVPPQGQYGAVPPQGQYGAVPPQGQSGSPFGSGSSSVGGAPGSQGCGWLGTGIVLLVIAIGVGSAIWSASDCTSCSSVEPVPISFNVPVQGELTSSTTYQLWELGISEPTWVIISVNGTFDNYLELYQGDAEQPMLQDDDSGDGLNAQLSAQL